MESLKVRRGRVKASLSRIHTFASNIPANATITQLCLKRDKVEEIWSGYHQIENEMIDLAEDPNTITDTDVVEFETHYYTIRELLDQRIEQISRNDIQPNNTINDTNMNTTTSIRTETQLPKIHIKPFSGDFTEWNTFRDLFESTVHNNNSLTACQKFYYLKSFLVNEPANLLTHVSVTDINYLEAWEKLNKRYDKKGHIANALVKKFINLSSGTQSYASLRKLVDNADEILRGLRALGSEADTRDIWLIYILYMKLDAETQHAWATHTTATQFPTLSEFLSFLESRCDILAPRFSADKNHKPQAQTPNRPSTSSINFRSFHTTISPCLKCQSAHELYQCTQFAAMSPQLRRTFAQTKALCFNCLRAGHRTPSCRSTHTCRHCQNRHHTLLHTATTNTRTTGTPRQDGIASSRSSLSQTPTAATLGPPREASTPLHSNHTVVQASQALVNAHSVQDHTTTQIKTYLPTALVNTRDRFGTNHTIRILLDSGSQCSFITEACVQRLGLSRSHAKLPVSGLSSTGAGTTRGTVSLTLQSRLSAKSISMTAYIMSHLTSLLPNFRAINNQCPCHSMVKLADPDYAQPGPIDVIIGADKTFSVLENQILKGPPGSPSAVLTIFGWVIAGETTAQTITQDNCSSSITTFHTTLINDFDLKRFWELEEVSVHSHLSEEEQRVESHFGSSHSRSADGKYIVELPFKDGEWKFGNSLSAAISRQKSMERKFAQNSILKDRYSEFMAEYLTLGHMSPIPQNEIYANPSECYYLPHHAVFKEDSSTTKLRVVFDGSAKSSNGISLNETLSIGPPIQRDLFCVCTRFRRHKYCFSADIKQMFRQIWVAGVHRDFQRIVWRDDLSKPFIHYRLNTVTYGTSPAPFLSVRTLMQLATDNEIAHPEIANVISKDFYVDDVLSGSDTIEDITKLRDQLMMILSSAGFHLRKWSTNCLPLLLSIPEDQRELSPLSLQESSSIKILGLRWCPADDSFSYKIALPEPTPFTKRSMLSEAARVFDPLGFLAPSIVLIKLLFQELWCRKLDWDDLLPDDLAARWGLLRSEISKCEKITIPRRIWSTNIDLEFHGFCDASQNAYAAVIYCRSRDQSGNIQIVLVAAKTKAAPLKQISLPRLELCGALLLSRLFDKVFRSFQKNDIPFSAWTDSQLVLNWLSSPPRRWSTFIANRTSEILQIAPRTAWSHVRSAHNPADCASRGILPTDLIEAKIWWNGPPWLQSERADWPVEIENPIIDSSILEIRKTTPDVLSHHLTVDDHILTSMIVRISTWTKLYRVLAYCYRFCSNLKNQASDRNKHPLSTLEINKAKIFCLQFAQRSAYAKEIKLLSTRQELPSSSSLLALTPFLDSDNLLRVGGRINRSTLSFSAKHPIILPKHEITQRIVQHLHRQHLHVGASSLFAIIRQQYWIIGARNLARNVVHQCIPCFKQRKTAITQLMGELPMERIRSAKPFSRVGVDYAGPITIRAFRGRNPKYSKGYICLFVCFVTRAIHLELANDLTTDAFLAALDRFCARRGKPRDIHSDNGTNFQGARRKLDEMYQLLLSQTHNTIITDHVTQDHINWHFIPPASPHFGGLWEAGVKSVKAHLKRVIGTHILTYEELYTLLTRIEAVLNSRPLCAVSDNDVDILTPAHFINGEPYTSIPEPDVQPNQISLRSNWQLLRHLSQGFWKRWHQEYITSLQQRPKWRTHNRNVQVGDVVMLNESNLPASKWIIGKIENVIAGSDGYVRIAQVKTERGTYERPITKIAVLPLSESKSFRGRPGCSEMNNNS